MLAWRMIALSLTLALLPRCGTDRDAATGDPAPICVSGVRTCQDGDVYECVGTGARLALVETCDDTCFESRCCVRACVGRECGSDGCGGTCGAGGCAEGATCHPDSGQCVIATRCGDGVCSRMGAVPAEDCAGCPADCSCGDGDPCNGEERCDESTGLCAPGEPIACDDLDACNGVEACDPDTGACVSGEPLACDDQDPCTADDCLPGSGCTHAIAAVAPCEDGDACTQADACDGRGDCVGGPSVVCDDENPCTEDACDPGTGCRHRENGACECETDEDSPPDVDLCDGARFCDVEGRLGSPRLCRDAPETAVRCDDPDDPCLPGSRLPTGDGDLRDASEVGGRCVRR